jgi:hypothetical protein
MATESIEDAYVYLTNGTVSGDTITYTGSQKVVKILHTSIEDIDENELGKLISVPVSRGNQPASGGTGTPKTLIVNLLRIKRAFTINGFLLDETGATTPGTSGYTKKSDLRTLNKYGYLTLVWGTTAVGQILCSAASDEGVVILKSSVKEQIGQMGESSTTESDRIFSIQIQLVQGVRR